MGWQAITIDTLREAKIAALIDACDSVGLAEGQANRAAGLIAKVVTRVRRKVASCASNRVDEDETTVPAGLVGDTVKLVIAELKNSVEEALTDDEQNELRRINSDLNRIAECKDAVDQPDTPVEPEVESTAGTPRITPKTRNFKREDSDGV